MLHATLQLLAHVRTFQLRVEASRLLGNQLSRVEISATQRQRGQKALIDSLSAQWPKIQWNAAAAMEAVLGNRSIEPDPDMVQALWRALKNEKNIKVRRSVLAALQANPSIIEDASHWEDLSETIANLQALQGRLRFEDAQRAKQLQMTVRPSKSQRQSKAERTAAFNRYNSFSTRCPYLRLYTDLPALHESQQLPSCLFGKVQGPRV